jgi:radical SAM protein with 4Fe4S-binding SPASM domain
MNYKIDYAMIEPTTACNLRCKTCTRDAMAQSDNFKIGHITIENLETIKQQLPDLKHIRFHGMGEIFLIPNHIELLEKLRHFYPKSFIEIVTNGQYRDINNKKITRLVNHITFSVDASDKKTYEELRTGSKWELLNNNINQIIKNNVSAYIEINFVWSGLNLYSIIDMPALAKRFGINAIRVNLVQNWDNVLTPDVLLHKKNLKEIFEKAKEKADRFGVKLLLMGNPDFEISSCEWMNNRIVISLDGEVLPCCMRQDRKMSFGNIYKNDVDIIWNSEKMVVARQFKGAGSYGKCLGCPYVENKQYLKDIL